MWNYTDKVMDHFLNPRNVGEIKDADAVAEVGNISCGDALKLYLKLDEQGKICDVKFQTFGCASAIASSSALTEMIKGMTLEEAGKLTNQDIVDFLGDLPEAKTHCSVMGMEALQAAIANYHGAEVDAFSHDHDEHEGEIVCQCFGVTDVKVRQTAHAHNVTKAEDLKNYIKAGGGCGCCLDTLQEILDTYWAEQSQKDGKATEALSPVQKILKIQSVIDTKIKPVLKRDGGDIEFLNLVGNTVQVKLQGACAMCPSSKITLKNLVEKQIRDEVSPELEIEAVHT